VNGNGHAIVGANGHDELAPAVAENGMKRRAL
jgi:hypothetical protein